mmetsp:Transcript_35907/g.58943  ORF Transcript_35907/g.58943 Transcript_35907/m.58943 type:complete len:235 (+) Transcript_35907:686-1390(+)
MKFLSHGINLLRLLLVNFGILRVDLLHFAMIRAIRVTIRQRQSILVGQKSITHRFNHCLRLLGRFLLHLFRLVLVGGAVGCGVVGIARIAILRSGIAAIQSRFKCRAQLVLQLWLLHASSILILAENTLQHVTNLRLFTLLTLGCLHFFATHQIFLLHPTVASLFRRRTFRILLHFLALLLVLQCLARLALHHIFGGRSCNRGGLAFRALLRTFLTTSFTSRYLTICCLLVVLG